MKRNLLILSALLCLLLAGIMPVMAQEAVAAVEVEVMDNYLQNVLPKGWGFVSVNDFNTELLENPPFILDVREPNEWEEGHIEGAVHIPLRTLAQNLDLLPADLDAPIVVYCKVGHRGTIGMVALQILGYTNVRSLSGGINGWIGADLPITTEAEEPARGDMPDLDPELLATVDAYLSALPQGWGVVTVDNFATELLENPSFILDLREQNEWDEEGRLEDAVHIPLRTLAQNLDLLPEDKSAPIVVYCKVGGRGAIGMTALQMLGYTNVRNLSGGISAWKNGGYAVVGLPEAEPEAPAEIVLPEGTPLTAEALQSVVSDYLATLPQGFASVPVDQVLADLGKVFLLDVRELDEYEAGHIAGAVNIPIRELAQKLHLLPAKDQPIIVYCAVGHRGGIATMALRLLGYENAVSMRTGLKGWNAASYELVKESDPAVALGAFPEVDADLWATLDAYLSGLPAGFFSIKVDDLNVALVENPPFMIDVREPAEFEGGRIGDAVNMPVRQFASFMDELPALDTPIVIYDSIGHRSVFAMEALHLLGYQNVRSLGGGSDAWKAAGFELGQ